MNLVYHLARRQAWEDAQPAGSYRGTPEDRADGFIHFSTAAQIAESARLYRAGEPDLILLACRAEQLGDALKWEPSRGGDLFPHLYGDLPLAAVAWAKPLALDANGLHIFPPWTRASRPKSKPPSAQQGFDFPHRCNKAVG